ncbi:DUF3392 family protein [Pseudoalteromonas sp. T1lg75]|uniref:DUF3392 family protein n=1 Tax=Pseudoalteromonas sp. T1lg75 TaxID=2077102 RepID=UPI000CF67A03|nr:DUF3392 family protein [Pseudoalteromonas sp. T1lg75]
MNDFIAWLESGLFRFGQWLSPYLGDIALVFVVCIIGLYAGDVIKTVKKLVAGKHFLLRTLVFVLVSAFGLGVLTLWVSPFMAKALMFFGSTYLPLMVFAAFILVGVLADRKSQL